MGFEATQEVICKPYRQYQERDMASAADAKDFYGESLCAHRTAHLKLSGEGLLPGITGGPRLQHVPKTSAGTRKFYTWKIWALGVARKG